MNTIKGRLSLKTDKHYDLDRCRGGESGGLVAKRWLMHGHPGLGGGLALLSRKSQLLMSISSRPPHGVRKTSQDLAGIKEIGGGGD